MTEWHGISHLQTRKGWEGRRQSLSHTMATKRDGIILNRYARDYNAEKEERT